MKSRNHIGILAFLVLSGALEANDSYDYYAMVEAEAQSLPEVGTLSSPSVGRRLGKLRRFSPTAHAALRHLPAHHQMEVLEALQNGYSIREVRDLILSRLQ